MKNVQVIVLAAGKGTRMQSDLPKALTPLRGKPFLNYVLDAIEGVGLSNKPVVVTGYKRELLAPHIPESHTVVVQEEQLGTGHAVKITRDAVGEDVDIAVVLFADQPLVTSTTIRNLIKKHIEASDATITMATTDIGDYDEWRKDAFV